MKENINPKVRFKRDDGSEYPDWEKQQLGDCGLFIRGLSYNKSDVTNDTSKTLVLRSNNIIQDGIADCNNSLQYVSKIPEKEQLLKKGDVIICLANGSEHLVGKTCYYNGNYTGVITVGAFCGIYRSNNPIVPYIVQTSTYKEKITTIKQGGGGALSNLYGKDILSIKFMMPSSIEEQQKISSCLSTYDLQIESAKRYKKSLEELKRGVMQKIFNREVRFKKDDGSEYPDWEEKNIGEIYSFSQGQQINVDQQYLIKKTDMFRFIRIIDVTQTNEPFRYINSKSKKGYVCQDDVFVVRYGAIGTIGYGFEGIIANNLFKLVKKQDVNSKYIYYLLSSPKINKKIIAMSDSTTMPAINFSSFNKIKLSVPCLEEQQKISSCLSLYDKAIETQDNIIRNLELLKKGLMQRLF